jgi:hypothetical protein
VIVRGLQVVDMTDFHCEEHTTGRISIGVTSALYSRTCITVTVTHQHHDDGGHVALGSLSFALAPGQRI